MLDDIKKQRDAEADLLKSQLQTSKDELQRVKEELKRVKRALRKE